jgi:hypothetical protein
LRPIDSNGADDHLAAVVHFTAVSEIPLFGSRAAAISCCSEASTKALEVVPKAFFSLCHHSQACPSGG